MKKYKILVLFLLVSLVVQAQKSVTLRMNYNVGDVYKTTITTSQQMADLMKLYILFEMKTDVLSKEQEDFITESKFTHVVMNMEQLDVKMSYDSKKPDDDLDEFGKQLKDQMAPALTAVIKTTITPLGKNKNIEIIPTTAMVAADMANQASIEYPEKALFVGDSWDFVKDDGGLKIISKYTIQKIEKETVTAAISGTVSGEGNGKLKGNIVIDIKTGMPKSSELDMNIKVEGMDSKTKILMTTNKL